MDEEEGVSQLGHARMFDGHTHELRPLEGLGFLG